MTKTLNDNNLFKRILELYQSDPILVISACIALIGFGLYEPYAALSTFVGISLMGLAFQAFHWIMRPKTTTDVTSSTTKKSTVVQNQSPSLMSKPLKNVWDVGKSSGQKNTEKLRHDEKPFGSKYYYAHNNPNATGGYKDGLRMEDYRMNGPRLLSKGGQQVVEEEVSSEPVSEIEQAPTGDDNELSSRASASLPDQVVVPALAISKYLWDDPGDWEGVGTIRIDKLPVQGGVASDMVDWKDIAVREVSAELVDGGLSVKIVTDKVNYQLKIKKLYGNAYKVEALRKTKRLLIKIYKKKNAIVALMDKSNLEPWPHPHKKI